MPAKATIEVSLEDVPAVKELAAAAAQARIILARTREVHGVFYALSPVDQLLYTRTEDRLEAAIKAFYGRGKAEDTTPPPPPPPPPRECGP
jgi:hypothetical protein